MQRDRPVHVLLNDAIVGSEGMRLNQLLLLSRYIPARELDEIAELSCLLSMYQYEVTYVAV
jgi:hypothetical protein